MANFKKQTIYSSNTGSATLSSTDTYEQYVNYDLVVDDADTGVKLLSVDPESRTTSEDWSNIKTLCVQCISRQPVEVIFKTTTWTDDTTNSGNDFFHTILNQNEMISIPNAKLISYDGSGQSAGNGTSVSLVTANTVDAGINVAGSATGSSGDADATDTDFLLASTGAAIFEVGDKITWDGSATYTIGDEVAEITNVNETMLTLKRAQVFTAVDTWSAGNDVLFYWITDANGDINWRAGANDIATGSKIFGGAFTTSIVPGTIAIQFYSKPYQTLGLSEITASTSTGLTAGATYGLKLTIDAVVYDDITFAVDSSNVNWGGTNGVTTKIQNALDTNNVPCTVAISGRDIIFTSKLGTKAGSIALASPTGGSTTIFGAGNIPALTSINAAVGSIIDLDYGDDNFSAAKLMYDDGKGNLYRGNGGTGTINYDTGAINMIGVPSYTQFQISFIHASPLGGKIDLDGSDNYLAQVNVRSLNTKKDGKVKVIGYY